MKRPQNAGPHMGATAHIRRLRRRTGLFTRRQRQLLSMILLALIVSVEFFENIMFVFAAGHIMGGVNADPRGFALAQAMYAIGSMLMIVKQQWLARRFGYRRYLTAALSIFIAGTLAAAASASLSQLVAARFVQGFGGGALFTSSRVLIMLMFPPADRPRAQRIFMIGIFSAVALAPAAAAEFIDHGAWRDVFYGALPLAVVAAIGAWRLLPDAEPRERHGKPVLVPLLWFGLAIAALQLAMTEARFDLFAHPVRPALLACVGAALLAGFLHHQWRHEESLLRLRVLRNPVYLTGLGLYFIYYLISRMNGYLFPIYAERALHIPLFAVGWLDTLSGAISFIGILAYIRYARLLKRKKPIMVMGLLVMALAAWMFGRMPADAAPAALIPLLAAKGLFGVLVVIPVAGLTFRGLGESTFAHGYQSKNLMRQVAGSLAASLGAVLLENRHVSVRSALVDSTGRQPGATMQWLDHAQAGLVARGMDAGHAAQAALARMAEIIERQATLIASEDMYRLIAVLALAGALVVLAQRRLA